MNTKAAVKVFVFAFLMVFLTLTPSLGAADYNEGAIRLVLHERTGRFSLYSLRHPDRRGRPLPLFSDTDPRTTFFSLRVNRRIFEIGDSGQFKMSLGYAENPSFVFEAPPLRLTQNFFFVRSSDSRVVNGVQVTFSLENWGNTEVTAGGRFLFDPHLSEGQGRAEFQTNRRTIGAETLLTREHRDIFWIDTDGEVSLTGSLFSGLRDDPNRVHFANWKRLNGVRWDLTAKEGRSFTFLNTSVRDSGIAYFYDDRPLRPGRRRNFTVYFLLDSTTGLLSDADMLRRRGMQDEDDQDEDLFDLEMPAQAGPWDEALAALRALIVRIERLIIEGTVTDEEVNALEDEFTRLKEMYNVTDAQIYQQLLLLEEAETVPDELQEE